MKITLQILVFLMFLGNSINFIYTVIFKTRKIIKKYNPKFAFECSNCKNIHYYGSDEYFNIIKKPRTRIRAFGYSKTKYYFLCQNCNKKTGQLFIEDFFDKNIRNEIKKEIIKSVIIITIVGFGCSALLSVIEKM